MITRLASHGFPKQEQPTVNEHEVARAEEEPRTEAVMDPDAVTDAVTDPDADREASGIESMPEHAADAVAPEVLEHAREVARLERLLAERSRLIPMLEAELGVKTRLLRQALEDVCALGDKLRATSTQAASVVSETRGAPPDVARDGSADQALSAAQSAMRAALGRGLEAEARCVELEFRLDEALGHLTEKLREDRARADSAASLEGALRGQRARIAELDESLGVSEARRVLLEQDLDAVHARLVQTERAAHEASEAFEIALLQERTKAAEADRALAWTRNSLAGTRGERDGLRARLDESERAFASLNGRRKQLETELRTALDKLEALRAAHAELSLSAQTRDVRISELSSARENAERDLRGLHAELSERDQRSEQAQRELSQGREQLDAALARIRGYEFEREELVTRLAEAERSAEREAARAAGLDRLVHGVRAPLSDLQAALHAVVKGTRATAVPETEVTEEPTLPGTVASPELTEMLESKLKASEARVLELEAALAGRLPPRDASVSALKGELIDVRASASRLADDLARERARRRKLAVSVRALQAVIEAGENPGPWLDELVALINDGASIPPALGG